MPTADIISIVSFINYEQFTGYAVHAIMAEPGRSIGFALQPVSIIFQDNVYHDLTVNKAAQP